MPTSQQPKAGEDAIREAVLDGFAGAVVDVGPCDGRWGKLLRGRVARVDAVEIWEPYVNEFGLRSIYGTVHLVDARRFKGWDQYEAAILCDVLEHMPREDADALVSRMLQEGLTLFMSAPVTDCPQCGDSFGNPYETHVDQWTHDEFVERGWKLLHSGQNGEKTVTVNTYYMGRLR